MEHFGMPYGVSSKTLSEMARQIEHGDALEDLRQEQKAELRGISLADAVHVQDMTINKSLEFQLTAEDEEHGEPGNITSPKDALRFISAGNAYFTVRSNNTSRRFTYRVRRAECSRCKQTDCNCWRFPWYFVSVMTGSDNEHNYTFIGILKENQFKRTPKSKLKNDDIRVISFDWLWRFLNTTMVERFERLQVWHEGRCGRCGRKLTVPESIKTGIGPDCAERMGL